MRSIPCAARAKTRWPRSGRRASPPKPARTRRAASPSCRTVKRLEPHRLFPISGGDKYITLLDEEGIEQAIIRDLDTLLPESQAVIREALEEYYLIPKITRVNDATERYGIKWWVETDRGPCEFQIRLNTDIKVFYDNRVMIRDVNDNRYEIPDYTKLDKHSLHVLGTQI